MEDQAYKHFVDQLILNTVDALRNSSGDPDAIRYAIQTYLHEGNSAGLTADEMIDFFCVSTPNIVESVGVDEDSAEHMVAMFDTLHDAYRRAK